MAEKYIDIKTTSSVPELLQDLRCSDGIFMDFRVISIGRRNISIS